MKQLVELQEHAEDFKKLNAELIFVFREETGGVEALEKIRDKAKTSFTLSLDLEKKSTKLYSPKDRTFDNYVVDSDGVVRKIVDGTLRTRAKAEQLIETLETLQESKSESLQSAPK